MDKQTILTLAALLLTSSAWGQSKQEGEVELSGGYGNTAPYASDCNSIWRKEKLSSSPLWASRD